MDLDSCTHQCLPRKAEWLDSERHKLRHLENKHHSRLKVELKLLLGWTGVGKWIQFSAGWASAEALQGTLLAPLTAGCSCASWETRSFFSFSFIYFFKLIIIDCNFPPGSTSWDVDTLTPSPGLAEVPTAFAISPAWVVLSVWGQVDRQWFLCVWALVFQPAQGFAPCASFAGLALVLEWCRDESSNCYNYTIPCSLSL